MFSTKQKQWQHKTTTGSVKGVTILVISVLAAILLLLYRQYVVDQLIVWQYQPSPEIAGIVERSGMNGNGTFLFYASHPAIEDAARFNQNCSRKEMSTAILGCYNGQNIFIYNVKDARLNGIREVTAAHEMLHAAYVRLDEREKSKLHDLLSAEYEKLKDEREFAERMTFYERTEPGERDNELHSIIGTEVKVIGTELEDYYKKYFQDRTKVVAFHQGYAKVFNDLQSRAEDIAGQLTTLADSIEAESAVYNRDVTQLNQDIAAFNDRVNSGGFSSNEEFQAARAALVARAERLEAKRAAINDDITHYEQLRVELAAVAQESEALNKSIDSSLAPSPSL